AIAPGMVDWAKALAGARWFHVTGITPALSATAADATREALAAAKKAGLSTSVDLNYRVKLWTPEQAGRCMNELMQLTDVLVTTEEYVERVFRIKGANHEEAVRKTAERFGLKVVAITLRDNPLVWKNTWTAMALAEGKVLRTRTYEVEIVDRLGAGDSFAAGRISRRFGGDPPPRPGPARACPPPPPPLPAPP